MHEPTLAQSETCCDIPGGGRAPVAQRVALLKRCVRQAWRSPSADGPRASSCLPRRKTFIIPEPEPIAHPASKALGPIREALGSNAPNRPLAPRGSGGLGGALAGLRGVVSSAHRLVKLRQDEVCLVLARIELDGSLESEDSLAVVASLHERNP